MRRHFETCVQERRIRSGVFDGGLVRDFVPSVQARGGYYCVLRAVGREGGIRGVGGGKELHSNLSSTISIEIADYNV